MGISFFEVFQETFYPFAPCGKDGETDQDKKYPLEKWQKKTKDPHYDKKPADN